MIKVVSSDPHVIKHPAICRRHLKAPTGFGNPAILFLSKIGLLFLTWRNTEPLLLTDPPRNPYCWLIPLAYFWRLYFCWKGERAIMWPVEFINPWSNASFIYSSFRKHFLDTCYLCICMKTTCSHIHWLQIAELCHMDLGGKNILKSRMRSVSF